MNSFKETVVGILNGEYSKTPYLICQYGSHSIPRPIYSDLDEDVKLIESGFGDDPDWQERIHSDLHSELSHDDLRVVHQYTSSSSGINRSLWNHFVSKSPIIPMIKTSIDKTDSLLDRNHKTTTGTVLTGLRFGPHRFIPEHHGDHFEYHVPAFTSTTTVLDPESVTKSFSHHDLVPVQKHIADVGGRNRHCLMLHLHNNAKALSVAMHSVVPSEYEVLLHRGMNISVSTKPDVYKDFVVWHGSVIDHSPEKL